MSSRSIVWLAGNRELRTRIESACARALDDAEPIQESVRRTLHHLVLVPREARPANAASRAIDHDAQSDRPTRPDAVLKIFHRRRGIRALRDAVKGRLGRSAARREWTALGEAHARGLSVPEPLAYGRLARGDEILVTRFVPGRSLLEALPDFEDEPWKRICEALAASIRAFHDAGLRHADLHAGNLRLGESGVVLLDLQRTRRLRDDGDRLDDLAQLAFSLQRSGASPQMQRALRSALGTGAELDQAVLRFASDYQRGRARRQLRLGRNWQRVEGEWNSSGMRASGVDFDALQKAFSPMTQGVRESRRTKRVHVRESVAGDRPVILKTVAAGSLRRAVADLFRGSAGARAFRQAQADRLISLRAAPALAYLDRWRGGLPVESGLFMEKVGDEDLDRFEPSDSREARRVARALGAWLAEDHARGLSHRDLKGGNIRIRLGPESIRFWLIDLQDLTKPARLTESARIEALSQLNASLAHEAFDHKSRRAGLEAYAERLPFSVPLETAAAQIAERSRARQHRWRGEDCSVRVAEEP